MASCSYHSPQFSEDIAWLPPWLQPHQLPTCRNGTKDVHTISKPSCKSMPLLPQIKSDGQDSQLSTKGDAKYSGFRLYLSGDGNSPAGNTELSAEGLQFHLHLSSLGVSQLSTSQLNKISQLGIGETNEDSSRKQAHKIPAVQDVKDVTISKSKMEDEVPALESPIKNKSRIPCRRTPRSCIKADDINYAVELSITASEAMAISDMVTSSLLSETLPAASILEIALRVKKARKECSVDILEADELSENDLSDLDEIVMADAFDDVGLLTQIVEYPDNSHRCGNSLQSNQLCNTNTQIPESHFGIKGVAQSSKLKVQETASSMPKYLSVQPPPVQETKPSAFAPLDGIKSCSKSQPNVDAQILQQNAHSSIQMHTGSKEDQGTHKDAKVSPHGDATIRKSIRAFIMETSFISESMTAMDERMPEHIAEAEPEIVASSSLPSINLHRIPHSRENGSNIHEDCGLTQDVVRSSIFSSIDPLCSVVPCSISSENAPISCDPLQEFTKKDDSNESNENINFPDVQEIPLKPLAEQELVFPNNNNEVLTIPSRKKFNSLRHFSTIMPDLKWCLQFSHVERNNTCSISKTPDVEISLQTNTEAQDDAGGSLIHHHEERQPPIVLNKKKRHLGPCKEVINGDDEEESLEKSLTSKVMKCKRVKYTDLVNCRDLTKGLSGLRSILSDKQSFKNKKVRFLEAKSSKDRTKGSNMLHGSRHGSKKRAKESSLPNKYACREGNCNSLTCQHTVGEKGMIFQALEFLLTGFSSKKKKELEALIRQYGGHVLQNIPSHPPDFKGKQSTGFTRLKLPIVLSPKKVQTTKYLYGCATNTWMLNADWLVDSIHAGSLLPPNKFMTRPIQGSVSNQLSIEEPFCLDNHNFIFGKVGIMLNGKASFCSKFSKIVKHGGGKVFKSLQRLVQSLKNGTNTIGAVVENEGNASRHLKHCALENNLQTVPASWIINSLFSGKLLPLKKERYAPLHRIKMPTFALAPDGYMSEEI